MTYSPIKIEIQIVDNGFILTWKQYEKGGTEVHLARGTLTDRIWELVDNAKEYGDGNT